MPKKPPAFLTDAQLKNEMAKCEYCEEKPCKEACPCDCSPADFIMAASVGGRSDYKRAAALILGSNPMGGICGAVCPDKFCMKACAHATFDAPLNIPAIQATIVQKAKDLGVLPVFKKAEPNGKKVAVVGAGPAGWSATSVLAQKGYEVHLYEAGKASGGAAGLIPPFRLDERVLASDVALAARHGAIKLKAGKAVRDPAALLKDYAAVVVATGLDTPYKLGIPGEELAVAGLTYLADPKKLPVKGKTVAVVGGGAIACDCAEVAVKAGAAHVELFALEKLGELPLTRRELDGILEAGVHLSCRVKVAALVKKGGKLAGLQTVKVALPPGKKFHPKFMTDCKGTEQLRREFDAVVVAIGARASQKPSGQKGVFFAGDAANGPCTVVEASASGKNAALEVDAFVQGTKKPVIEKSVKSRAVLAGRELLPVPLDCDFFGRRIISPFLLSAAPPSDGYDQMKKAYEAGWAGGVMKTAFDNVPIHIPGEYMFAFTESTYANCDNVSGHHLDRVCREIERLVKEYPDRLTMGSTGGPVTGNDESDRKGWQSNTRLLDGAGAMGVEYSLSCPQGGDGTKGDIVSQDAELTARIIDWVLEASDGRVPKLFKLTAAVTSIYPIMKAIQEVLARHPGKPAGVTLANTFPTLGFRKTMDPKRKSPWEEGVVVGMSGEGVIPISNLTLANVARWGIAVSGNGGPMDYKSAATFLALGAKTVQFCTVVMKNGYGVVGDLHSGLSYLMEERGLRSVGELIGCALPNPITGFMELTPEKKISSVDADLCQHCGNCTRCPYQAITLDEDKVPVTDAEKCIGCSICVQKCFSGALSMRDRTPKERKALRED